jgi:hypothetical protein
MRERVLNFAWLLLVLGVVVLLARALGMLDLSALRDLPCRCLSSRPLAWRPTYPHLAAALSSRS